ncbi:hypothetical protein [Halosimplex amylolyticum]|uniref:hypothetical protein n=1 Tax=Halosimplex amylolyticum TaxID=3396616 RepID=UPI003F561B03
MIDLIASPAFARAHGPYGGSAGCADAAVTADVGAVNPSGEDLAIGRSAGGNRVLEPTVAA